MKELTPKQIVKELDRYIVGQNNAKKAVAIAMRNRWRRQQVEGSMRNEIMPNNIIMIGSTGVTGSTGSTGNGVRPCSSDPPIHTRRGPR